MPTTTTSQARRIPPERSSTDRPERLPAPDGPESDRAATAERSVTLTDVRYPPGYFRTRKTGSVHLIRRARRVIPSAGRGWLALDFWCSNISTDAKGDLLTVQPVGGVTCRACLARRFRNLPRVRGA
jgi:hypothetical protein